MRFALLLMIVSGCFGGCTTTASFLGHDEDFVVRSLGKPEARLGWTVAAWDQPPWEGPAPRGLRVGETYVELLYPSIRGERWAVFLASPLAFEREYGVKPQVNVSDCVIDVVEFPKDAVFPGHLIKLSNNP